MGKHSSTAQKMIAMHDEIISIFKRESVDPEDAMVLLKSVLFDVLSRIKGEPTVYLEGLVKEYLEFLEVVSKDG